MKLFQTKGYKITMGFVYGWGATAVIVGALFKIMHFPGAGLVLTVGMLVEAAIFFLSAFEPPMEHYDWARVFPQLGKNDLEGFSEIPVNVGNQGNLLEAPDKQDLENLKKGIYKIVSTADTLATIVTHAPEVNQKIHQVSETFDRLNTQTCQIGDALENSTRHLISGCSEINQVMTGSVKKMAEEIENNFGKITREINQSSEGFATLNKLLEEHNRSLKNGSDIYSHHIEVVNKHIAALNALYELQIKQTGENVEIIRKLNGESAGMLQYVREGRENVSSFKQQAGELAGRVTSLNEVYGNMLSLVNNN